MSETGLSTLEAPAHERLIVALDVGTTDEARALVESIGDAVDFYKVGWELILSAGGYVELIRDLAEQYGKKVMADLKLHDIPETVRRAMRQLEPYHVDFVTFHAQEYAAIEAAIGERNGARVLAVTVLTSMDKRDLELQGIDNKTVDEVVLHRAAEALALGVDGVVSSDAKPQLLREKLGYEDFVIVTPGIRDSDALPDEQKRSCSVETAFKNGSDYIVVGRPITRAANPRDAALAHQRRIAAVFEGRSPA